MTAIPCRRPRVDVTANTHAALHGHLATCHVLGCDWTYPAQPTINSALKTDAEYQARRHRGEHRAAVPTITYGPIDSCECGWTTPYPVSTSSDRKASLDHHLSATHGLVTC